ncbi:MAG: beta-N-acetylhexosaminidase, partial [Actinomycetia bacterium]|nr:beta-N-acetylhexosaminidase [Actinomycetes bacterium]
GRRWGQPSEPCEPSATSEPTIDAKSTSWGPTAEEIQKARAYADDLSIDELAGQLVIATYDGTEAPVDLVRDLHLGGVIAMEPNIESVDQITQVNETLQDEAKRPYPLWLSVDQEGGIVNRLNDTMTPFPTYMTYGAGNRPGVTKRAADASGEELRAAGFTAVYSPDADVTAGPQDPTIGSRSAGSRPALVSRTVRASLRGYEAAGIVSVIKHFPGHGALTVDSHESLPTQKEPLRRVRKRDYRPFVDAIEAGAPAVMIGHINIPALDDGVPASLSRKVITGELRKRLGFDGVVLTDAMNMGAIVDEYGAAEAAVMTVKAGSDLVLMPADTQAAVEAIGAAIESGAIPEQQARASATRTIALLLHENAKPAPDTAPGENGKASLAASKAAITMVDGPCKGALVDDAVQPVGDGDAVAAFTAAAERAGLDVASGPTVSFIGWGGSAADGDIVVTTDTPYALADSSASEAKIALYGETPQAMRALVAVLQGKANAPGQLPVHVDGVARTGC